ncbi:ABC transporter permease [Legionella israelensis]|uniref:Peptide ABC transporter permease n=1 Tax=Legionella israelensis TaxID=454 RepID=A0A0W0WMP6_9GAMM|nr:ABC transporter permease [Legionella israelensis]KTD33621.1 peptide ABC transporter permease [Legionella israelensis]QBS08797.1 ABC transporter permease [Legionella israelensis]SCY12547.1 peptide/nickel transport system permease protein [Legionella israelensis DSM 19235]STX58475.1 peptide ABC transporter permease [Legionella israelensis]
MTFEFLWTDRCFLLLLIFSAVLLVNGARKEHIRRSLSMIGRNPLAISSGIILALFLIIGILDSIHIKSPDKAASTLLDQLMAPIGTVYEKTYSAPLALKSYSSQTVLLDGQALQIYPRLKHINPAIKTEKDKKRLIRSTLYWSLVVAMIFTLLSWGLILMIRRIKKGQFDFSFNAILISVLITWFFIVFIGYFCFSLSKELHLLGTGKIGQDIFYYAVKSIRTGLVIGLLTTLFMMPLALFLGVSAGYFGGRADDIIQYIYTTLSSIPGVLLITASVLSMQTYIANHPQQFPTLAQSADARLLALCLILGVTSWTSLCRLIRAESLKLREVDFVMAARALGSSSFTILRKHLLPNVMHIVLITLVLDFSFLVLAEAVLSYVGVGVSPMTISWGNMINGARLELAREPIVWWPMMSAFFLMFILVLAGNLFADAVRDAFDPHRQA